MKALLNQQRQKELENLELKGTKYVLVSRSEIKKLRRAQVVTRTAIHPDTGEFIPWPMRMSSFIAVNLPISYGMIITAPTPFNTIVWQLVNQTYNAMVNYGNRNASSVYTTQDIMKSYTCACAASVGVALGIRKALEGRTRHMKGAKLIVFNSVSAGLAVASAGFLNAYLMR